jgi:hypothetical protein
MKATPEFAQIQEILERKVAELVHVLRKRDGITIEKSADQMDEIQCRRWLPYRWSSGGAAEEPGGAIKLEGCANKHRFSAQAGV